jgi:hypothetical protein
LESGNTSLERDDRVLASGGGYGKYRFNDWRVRVTMDTDKIKDIGKKTSEKAKDAGKDLEKAGKDAKAAVDKTGREVKKSARDVKREASK